MLILQFLATMGKLLPVAVTLKQAIASTLVANPGVCQLLIFNSAQPQILSVAFAKIGGISRYYKG